jgi:hypothetical protein
MIHDVCAQAYAPPERHRDFTSISFSTVRYLRNLKIAPTRYRADT